MPLGGEDAAATIEALDRHKKELRALVAQRVNLKFAPDLRFALDSSFEAQARIDALLRSPEVARDLKSRGTTRGRGHDRRRRAKADCRSPERREREQAASEALDPGRGRRLDQSRQADRRHLDPGRRAAQVPVQRQEGGPRGHARSARFGRAAGRFRRGDQDRADRPGRRQGLSLPRALGRGKRDRRRRGRDRRPLRQPSRAAEIEAAAATLHRPYRADAARPSPRSRSTARAPTISPARARAFEIAPRPITRLPPQPRSPPSPTRRCSRPSAARAPMCARSRATSAGRSAATAMWSNCGARASAPSPPMRRFRSIACRTTRT